jgi:hypothetical protein
MLVDIYVHGKGSNHIARYLSRVLGVIYDTDGEDFNFVLKGADSDKMPDKLFGSRVGSRIQIRKAGGPENGDFVWPKEFRHA